MMTPARDLEASLAESVDDGTAELAVGTCHQDIG